MTASVKDITDFEALPEEVKELARKYYNDLVADAEYDRDLAYSRGYKKGFEDGEVHILKTMNKNAK